MIGSRRTTTLLHLLGGLLALVVVVALPTLLGFAAPEALDTCGCAGDPCAAALRSLDQTLQGNRSVDRYKAVGDPAGPTELDLERADRPIATESPIGLPPGLRPTPVETRTTLTL